MLYVRLGIEDPIVEVVHDVCTIGSGGLAASLMLKHRLCNPGLSFEEACYLAYEAKRFSEVVPSVGPSTLILTQAALIDGGAHKVNGAILTDEALQRLETLRAKLTFQVVPGLEPFPDSFLR